MSGSREAASERRVMGLLFVDKPAGITSHDVVSVVRRAARSRRVGHAGTLDPFATGLLVVAIGQATRLLPYVPGEPKVYEARIRFGAETNTDDVTGTVQREAPPPAADAVDAAIVQLTGHLAQVPPAFSAKHVDGQRAYVAARRGREVALDPVPVTVHEWSVLARTADSIDVRITCAGGTYVRALARDLGRLSGSAAHCETLRRLASGDAHVREAVTLDRLDPGSIADRRVPMCSPLTMLGHLAHERLDGDGLRALSYGRAIPAHVTGPCAVLLSGDDVVGVADRITDAEGVDRWQPRVVLLDSAAAAVAPASREASA